MIRVNTTDRDVAERVAGALGHCYVRPLSRVREKPHYKDVYRVQVTGIRAIGWMMMLYSLMGQRRRAKIRELLAEWRAKPLSQRWATRYDNYGAHARPHGDFRERVVTDRAAGMTWRQIAEKHGITHGSARSMGRGLKIEATCK